MAAHMMASAEVNLPKTSASKLQVHLLREEGAMFLKQSHDLHVVRCATREKQLDVLLELRELEYEGLLLMHQHKLTEGTLDVLRKQREAAEREGASQKVQRQREYLAAH